jgi:hypothetical protein
MGIRKIIIRWEFRRFQKRHRISSIAEFDLTRIPFYHIVLNVDSSTK